MKLKSILFMAFGLAFSLNAKATLITTTSLTSAGAVPAGVTEVGGIVVDLIGANGTRVVSQLAASTLFEGFFANSPGAIGSQAGFDSSVYSALGGGIVEAAIRLTVFDGDTAAGEFDFAENNLLVNGLNFGDFSSVTTDITDGTGVVSSGTELGFGNETLNTGWFFSADATLLADLFSTIVTTETLSFGLEDVDPSDNFFDFTAGIDGTLINIGTGPIVTPPTPSVNSPVMFGLLAFGLVGLVFGSRRKA